MLVLPNIALALGSLLFVTAGVIFARRMWQRFVSVTHLSRKFLAWELEFLAAERSPRSIEEIRSVLITQSAQTEEQVEQLLPERQKRRWEKAFQESLQTIHDSGMAIKIEPNSFNLVGFGYWIAERQKPLVSRRIIKKLSKSWNKYLSKTLKADVSKVEVSGDKVSGYPKDLPSEERPLVLPEAPIASAEFDLAEAEFEPAYEIAEQEAAQAPEPELEAPAEGNVVEKPKRFPVWFATNRKPIDPDNVAKGFGRRRGDRTFYGRCTVNIPKGHRTGETQPTLLERWVDGKEGVVVQKIEGLAEKDFWKALGQTLRKDPKMNSMLLFIHGFNVTFVEAAIRTGQLKYDLNMDHAAFFSWPSLRRLWGYGADSTSAREATPYLAAFLAKLAEVTTNEKVNLHVIAHSMGNEAFLYALERVLVNLKDDATKFRLAEVVFAAPDVDANIFRDKSTMTIAMSRQRTLYASRKDVALGFSGRILRRRMVRAGKIPPVTIVRRIDTIDVTEIDLSLLGHGYVAETRPVITDMSVAMHYGSGPAKRTGLEEGHSPAGRYWVIT